MTRILERAGAKLGNWNDHRLAATDGHRRQAPLNWKLLDYIAGEMYLWSEYPPRALHQVRMRLRRSDGAIYLDRWGITFNPIGGVFLHKMSAPDPGVDLHDHPWNFWSLVLAGGYQEERAECADASTRAYRTEVAPYRYTRGDLDYRRRFTIRALRLHECHRITALTMPVCWTIIVHGPRRTDRPRSAQWGFFLPEGWVDEKTYDATVRRGDMWNEIG